MKYRITIPGELPSMNEIVDASKLHYMEYSNMKKENTNLVAWIAKAGIGKHLKKIDLNITWYCKDRRKDKDNISGGGTKMILDGLVMGGIITGDGWRYIGNITHSFNIDKLNPRIVVTIKEVAK